MFILIPRGQQIYRALSLFLELSLLSCYCLVKELAWHNAGWSGIVFSCRSLLIHTQPISPNPSCINVGHFVHKAVCWFTRVKAVWRLDVCYLRWALRRDVLLTLTPPSSPHTPLRFPHSRLSPAFSLPLLASIYPIVVRHGEGISEVEELSKLGLCLFPSSHLLIRIYTSVYRGFLD